MIACSIHGTEAVDYPHEGMIMANLGEKKEITLRPGGKKSGVEQQQNHVEESHSG